MDDNNINTKDYWNWRFSSGDWEDRKGRDQTQSFAICQIGHLNIPREFSGTIVDFGCGLGDAMPIYRRNFPRAVLIGVDISESAISKCIEKYGDIATFVVGTHHDVPYSDVIISSNVLEHLSDDVNVAATLLSKCSQLYVTVPYKEEPLCAEHVRSYDEHHFEVVGECDSVIFASRGWSEFGRQLMRMHLVNFYRRLTGAAPSPRKMQIMYRFKRAEF